MISVLYVDDEESLLVLTKRYLEKKGDFKVETAVSGDIALQKLETANYDAVVSDYQMPGMNGIELLSRIRNEYPDLPFIIFTGKGREEVVIEAFEKGADFYIQKGGDTKPQYAELMHKIQSAVEYHLEKSALEESEKKFHDFFKTSQDAVFITSLDGTIENTNESFVRMSGYNNRDEFLSVNVKDLYAHPEDREKHIRTIIENGYTREYPLDILKKDGTIIPILVTTVPRKDKNGAIIGFQGTIRDINREKLTADALRQSEAKFRNIYTKSPIAIELYDEKGILIDVNQACCELFGIQSADVVKGFRIFDDPNIPPEQRELLKNGEKIRYESEFDFDLVQEHKLYETTRSGTITIDVLITPLHADDTTLAGYLVQIIDRTVRKKAEDTLKLSVERFRTAMDSLDALVYVVDMHTYEILFINKYGRDAWGNIEGNICWKSIQSGQTGPCPFCTNDRIVDEHGNPTGIYHWEFQNTLNGKWYDCRDSAIRWIDGRLVRIEIATDITERKQAEEALQASEEKYREIFNNANDAIEIIEVLEDGRPGKFIEVNDTACRAVQYTREELLRIGPFDINTDLFSQPVDEILRELHSSGHATFETEHKRKDGKIVPVEINTHAITLQGKKRLLSVVRDITERKEAESALHESELVFREVFDNANDPVFLLERTESGPGKYVLVNDRAVRMLGYTKEEFRDMSPRDIVPEDIQRTVMPEVLKKLQQEGYATFESAHRRKDGSVYPVEVSTHTFRYKGKIVDLSITRDITSRNQAERALRESEKRFHSLFVHMNEGAALHELTYNDEGIPDDYVIIETNPAFEMQLGLSRDAVIGKTGRDAYGVAEPPYLEIYARVALDGEPKVFETYFAPLDKHFSISAYCPYKGSFVTIFEDITGRKRMELERETIQKQLKEAHHLAHIGVWDWDMQNDTMTWSEELYKIAGRDPSQPAPTYAEQLQIYTPASWNLLSAAVSRALTTGEPYNLELDLVRPDGSIRGVIAFGGVKRDEQGTITGLHGTLQDVTERRQISQALQQVNRKLNLLSSITRHDILNGVSVLEGYLDLAGDEINSPDLQEYFSLMRQALKAIRHQIEFSRQYQEIGVNAAAWQNIRETAQNASLVFNMANVTLTVSCGNIEIFADPLLQKVFYNLFDNAFRYAPPLSEISVTCEETGEGMSVIFADDGVGIPTEQKKHLFKRGFGNNTGLGLFLSREILAITGITITENGETGKGARFEMTVPGGAYRFSSAQKNRE